MKKALSLSLLAGAMAVMCCCAPSRPRTVENPVVEGNNTGSLTVTSVELTDSTTVLNVHAEYRPKYWMRIASTAFVEVDGQRYGVIGGEGITLDSLLWMPESGQADFSLIFPEVPASAKSLTFAEAPGADEWHIWGIDLTGKLSEPRWKSEAAKLKLPAADLEAPLPDVPMTVDSARVNVKVLGWQPDMPGKIEFYVISLGDAGESTTVDLKLDNNGCGTLRLWTPGLTELTTYRGRVAKTVCVAPGEELNLWLAPAGNSDVYSAGKLSAVDQAIAKMQNIGREDPDFSYQDTQDAYFAKIMNAYHAGLDSINAAAIPQMSRELALAELRNSVMDLAVNSVKQMMLSYYRTFGPEEFYKSWSDDKLTFTRLSDAQLDSIGSLFDPADPAMLWVNLGFYGDTDVDWTAHGASSSLPTAFGYLARVLPDAAALTLTDAQMDTLRQYGEFFANTAAGVTARAKALLESDAAKMVTPTPDVAADKVFDAIIAPHKGKVVMVDLWNTWCGPCRNALAANEPLKEGEFADSDVVWIYIANETSPMEKYLTMIPDIKGEHYRVNDEPWNAITGRFGVDGIPYYILVGRDGNAAGRPDLRDHLLYVSELHKALNGK